MFFVVDGFLRDRAGWQPRQATWYRERLTAEGWCAIGSHAYIAPPLAERAAALERV
jgi:hypothetical protein